MKYSIIIPTLNEEKLLPQLLEQINNPDLKNRYNLEIIISDGGSKDSTIPIALAKSDILISNENGKRQNISQGRNCGARHATGEILVFINADILFDNVSLFFNYLEINFINSEYRAMSCAVKVFPETEILSDRVFHWIYNTYFRTLNIIGIGMGRGECQVIKKDAFEMAGGYNEDLAAGEDFDLFRRIQKSGKILFTNKLFIYESPRRYRKLGYKTVTLQWLKNGLSVFFKNRSLDKEWEQVR